jgi:hypothetical protein
VRALKTNLFLPVPSRAAKVIGSGVVEARVDAGSIGQVVAFIAGSARSGHGVDALAKIGGHHTDFVDVEDPSFGALQANLIVPVPQAATGVGRSGVV